MVHNIIRSKKDRALYVGIADDLKRRLEFHNTEKVFATRLRLPFEIIYYEAHTNKYDVATREQFLKSGWRKNWIKRILRNYLDPKS